MSAFLHKLPSFLLALVRLPLDLLLLGYDFLRLSLWIILFRPLQRRNHPSDRFPAPLICSLSQFLYGSKEHTQLCGPARKYGSPWLFRLLCRWCTIEEVPGEGSCTVCRRPRKYLVSPLRYITVGLGLLALYLAIGGAVWWAARRFTRTRFWPAVTAARPAERPAAKPPQAATEGDTQKRMQAIGQVQAALKLREDGKTDAARLAFKAAVALDTTNLEAQTGLADCAYELGLYPEAEQALDRILQLDANSSSAHLTLARIEKASGKVDAATEHAKKALGLSPQSFEAMLMLSNCYLAAGQYDDAVEQAQAVTALDPQNPGVSLVLADVELARQSLIEAEKLYRRTLDLDPNLVGAKIGLARILRLRGEYSAAIDMLNDMLAKTPDSADATMELAEVRATQGKLDGAIAMLRSLRERQPRFHRGRARLAELLMYSGQVNAGYIVAQEMLKDDPGNFPAHVILANAFLQNGFPSLAIEHCRIALAQNAGRVMVIKLLTRACLAAGDYKNGAVDIRRVVEQRPADLEAKIMLAYCYEGMAMKGKSIELLEAAATAFPASAVPLSEMGDIYLRRGDQAAAAACYERALARAPADAIVLNNLAALMLEGDGDKDRAMELALQASKLLPGHPKVADTLGWAYCLRNQFDKATEYLVFAALQARQDPLIRYHLAEALYGKGEAAKARDQLKQALTMGQEFAAAPRATALLEKIRAELKESPAQGGL